MKLGNEFQGGGRPYAQHGKSQAQGVVSNASAEPGSGVAVALTRSENCLSLIIAMALVLVALGPGP